MSAAAAPAVAPDAADARAAHPALPSSDAALPSRPASPLSCSDADEHEHDGEAGDAMEPLLPRYRFKTAGEAVEEGDKARRRRRRLQVIALLVGAPLVVCSITAHLCLSSTSRSTRETSSSSWVSDMRSRPPPAPLGNSSSLSLAQQFLSDPTSVNKGVLPFDTSSIDPRHHPLPPEHPLTTSSFASSTSCLERYIATGDVCTAYDGRWADETARPKLDVVWTWVNGSSAELMTRWREEAQQESAARSRVRRWASRTAMAVRKRLGGAAVLRHFREHDELRFSIRSVVQSLGASSLSTLHLVVGDTRTSSPADGDLLDPDGTSRRPCRLAQLPQWLELSTVVLSEPHLVATSRSPQLLVHAHSELFKADPALDESAASAWQQKVLPSFNSLAIESQLANLPSSTSSSTVIYLNDDFFLHRQLELADLVSPLSGPVFRMQRNLLVNGVEPSTGHEDPEGEWRGLGYSAWLLDRRFGKRGRPYLVHVAKTLSLPLAREMQQVFLADLTKTAESRFRGRGPCEVQPLFFLTHYTIEKHREALLWSFLVARSDPDRSSTYSQAERRALLSALGYGLESPSLSLILDVSTPERRTLADLPRRLDKVGLPKPLETTLDFSSHDGYAFLGLEGTTSTPRISSWPLIAVKSSESSAGPARAAPPICKLDLVDCFGDDFLSLASTGASSVASTFRRIAFDKPQCGDCIIALLVGKSGEAGLEAFLPPVSEGDSASVEGTAAEEEEHVELDVQAVGLEGTDWRTIDFSRWPEREEKGARASLRARCAALIHRYSYSLGSSPAVFESIRHGGSLLSAQLDKVDTAFVALNDDVMGVSPSSMRDVDERLEKWFERTWPTPSPWERAQ
ncbi:hypothetical protein JCM9279_005333 [Rhodotorula babjevae]